MLLLQIMMLGLVSSNAQQPSSMQVKVEVGLLWDSVDGKIYLSGPFLNVESKLHTSENTVIGLRVGSAINTQRILTSDPVLFSINNDFGSNGVISFGPTFDYYFNTAISRPYLGVGLVHSFLTSTKKGVIKDDPLETHDLNVDNQVGFLLRVGVDLHKVVIGRSDLSKLILGLEFNYIPKADVKTSNGQMIGTIATSNIALSIGHTFGEGRD